MKLEGRRYRWRTTLRRHLPWKLLWLAPKGRKDCKNHQWYLSERFPGKGQVWHCYHCEPAEMWVPLAEGGVATACRWCGEWKCICES